MLTEVRSAYAVIHQHELLIEKTTDVSVLVPELVLLRGLLFNVLDARGGRTLARARQLRPSSSPASGSEFPKLQIPTQRFQAKHNKPKIPGYNHKIPRLESKEPWLKSQKLFNPPPTPPHPHPLRPSTFLNILA